MTATLKEQQTSSPVNLFLARSQTLNWELILYLVIFALAIFTRFYALGDRAMSHDESLHTRYAYNLYADGNFQHTPLMHGPILFHVTAFFYFLFGDNDFTARLYPAILGVIIILMPYLFRRWIGRVGALLASFMLLISPLLLYYNRYIRHDTPSIFFALLMIYAIMMYINGPEAQRRKGKWLYLLAGAMIGNLGSKETAFIYIAIIGTYLTLYWLVRLGQSLWQWPGKTVFYFLLAAILLAGVAALGVYVVWTVISPESASAAALTNGGWFNNIQSSSFIFGTLAVIVSALVFLIGPLLWAFRRGRISIRWRDVLIIVVLAFVICLGLIIIEQLSYIRTQNAEETAPPPVPGEDELTLVTGIRVAPLIIIWVAAGLVVLALLGMWRVGWWDYLKRAPEFDILIVMGSLILPWATAFILVAIGASPTDLSPQGILRTILAVLPLAAISITAGLLWNWRRWLICLAVFYGICLFFFTSMFTNMNGIGTGIIGSLGYWLEQQGVRRGSQPQYYYLGLIMPFYEFLPIFGSVLAMFSGLGLFWRYRRKRLEARQSMRLQTADALIDGEHELDSGVYAVDTDTDLEAEVPPIRDLIDDPEPDFPEKGKNVEKRVDDPEWLDRIPFLTLVSWWAILNLIGYTLAGEKMPWLGTHLTVPLIFLSGWCFGRYFERINRERLQQGGWLYLVLLPLLFFTLFQVVSPFMFGRVPFTGLQQFQLANSGQWLAVVAVSGFVILGINQLLRSSGWRHLRQMFAVSVFAVLSLLTARSALLASFINYDLANEYLVYAHAAPAVKTVLNQLYELSLQTTDGKFLSFSYDNEVSWPYSWYFRDYPNAHFFGSSPNRPVIDQSTAVLVGEANRAAVEPLLEDRFYHFEYIRLWWPMQDYFNLTPERLAHALDFSQENTQAALLRQGLFEIWWSRDYSAYGQAVGRTFAINQWPVSDRMHLYIRKDVASQIWDLGVGEGEVKSPLDELVVNVCNANWQLMTAEFVMGENGISPGQLSRPLGISIAEDGRLYAAEESTNRVSIFDRSGQFVAVLGGDSALFTRPNSVALGPDGNIYVADTWNYQVKVLSPEGELLRSWGRAGEFGAGAAAEPFDGLWGPRDIVVDAAGQVYVADTGNKRIRVYSSNGDYVRDIGAAGSAPGQLDEPSGMALHPDGRLFVADYWNRRISVFNTDGSFMYSFPVRAWSDEQGNRPYLAVDAERDFLYVTDPDAGRVLVYTSSGECLGSFGQPSREGLDNTQFRSTSGIALDAQGNIFVSDSGGGRILKFAPFNPRLDNIAPVENEEVVIPDENTEEALPNPEITAEVAG